MVEERNNVESRPPKRDGIDVMMYPLNPDGSWKNGVAPPDSTTQARSRPRGVRSRSDEQPPPRVHSAGSLKSVRVTLSRDYLRRFTVRQVVRGGQSRIEISSTRSESPTLVQGSFDADQDSPEEIIFVRDGSSSS